MAEALSRAEPEGGARPTRGGAAAASQAGAKAIGRLAVGATKLATGFGAVTIATELATAGLKYFLDNDSTTLETVYSKVFDVPTTGSNNSIGIKVFNNDNSLYLNLGRLNFVKNGCTVPTANNYNQYANTNDNTCTGCTDASATNYDANVVVSDNTCVFGPTRSTVENEITITVPHQTGMEFNRGRTSNHLQYFFNNNAINTYQEYSNVIKFSNLVPSSYKLSVNLRDNNNKLLFNVITGKIMTLTGRTRTIEYAENAPATVIDDSFTISDEDTNKVDSVSILVSDNFLSGDSLLFTTNGTISGTYSSTDKELKLRGRDTIENYNTVLRSVKYVSPNENITKNDTQKTRSFKFTVFNSNDAGTVTNKRSKTQIFNIVAGPDNPLIQAGKTINTTYTEHGVGTFVDDSLVITDTDDEFLDRAVVRVSSNYLASDSLFFGSALPNGISKLYTYGEDSLVLEGKAVVADYVTALRTLKFKNLSNNPTDDNSKNTRVVQISCRDNGSDNIGKSISNIYSRTIDISPLIDSPVLSAGKMVNAIYEENGSQIFIDDSLTLTDVDDLNIDRAVARITSNFLTTDKLDVLTVPTGVTKSYNFGSNGDSIVLSGVAAIGDYQTALRSLTYRSLSENPTDNNTKNTRTVQIFARDNGSDNLGKTTSNILTRIIDIVAHVDNPLLTKGKVVKTIYIEQAPGSFIDDSITITDVDDEFLDKAVVRIGQSNYLNTDSLFFSSAIPNGITSTYDFGTGNGNQDGDSIVLSGTDTLANYQTALRLLKFNYWELSLLH